MLALAVIYMNKEKLEYILNELADDLDDASLSFGIWRELTDANNRSDFEEALNDHSLFFQTIIYATLVTLVITLYRLFENRKDTINIPNFVNETYKLKLLSDSTKDIADRSVENISDAWKKICILRSNVFGHKSRKLNPDAAFIKAKITPDQLEKIIVDMQDLVNVIGEEVFGTTFTSSVDLRYDIHNVIKLLKKTANK